MVNPFVKSILLPLLIVFPFLWSCEWKDKKPLDHSKHKSHSHRSHSHDSLQSHYTCSMHPQIKLDRPGKCPICSMNLIKMEIEKQDNEEPPSHKEHQTTHQGLWQCKDHPDVISETKQICPEDGYPMVQVKALPKAGEVIAKIKLKKSQLSHFSPDYFPVSSMKMSHKVRLLGSVKQSEEQESRIPARIDGRVEEVFVKSTGSLIKPGDAVVKIYSPRLITAGEEYILARRSSLKGRRKEFKNLLTQSTERLRLWGIQKWQYQEWFRKGKVPREITIYATSGGVVRKRHAIKGKYFKEGQNFFELSDLSSVWVEMDVYEHNASLIKMGQKLSLKFTALPGKKFIGSIDFIHPVLDSKSRTLKIRTTIHNEAGQLMPGMVAEATLLVESEGRTLVVPRSAIIDTGERKIVWVKMDGKQFQAKNLTTGLESEGYVEVLTGLREGELVVTEGNFLLDAQSQLFGGYEDFKNSRTQANEIHKHNH